MAGTVGFVAPLFLIGCVIYGVAVWSACLTSAKLIGLPVYCAMSAFYFRQRRSGYLARCTPEGVAKLVAVVGPRGERLA